MHPDHCHVAQARAWVAAASHTYGNPSRGTRVSGGGPAVFVRMRRERQRENRKRRRRSRYNRVVYAWKPWEDGSVQPVCNLCGSMGVREVIPPASPHDGLRLSAHVCSPLAASCASRSPKGRPVRAAAHLSNVQCGIQGMLTESQRVRCNSVNRPHGESVPSRL